MLPREGGGYLAGAGDACFIAVYTYAVLTPTPAVNEPIRKQSCGNYTETVPFLGTALVFLFGPRSPRPSAPPILSRNPESPPDSLDSPEIGEI